jgi:hypothetical protein
MARRRKQSGGSRLRAYGLLIILVLAIASLVGWGVGKVFINPGPETTPNAAPVSSVAQQLANSDGGVGLPVDYQTALDGLAGKCTQGESAMAVLVDNAYATLASHGVTTLSRLTMLQYLNGEMAPGVPKVDCGPPLNEYVTSNEG